MKLKQRPDDFRVEELADPAPRDDSAFALYHLDKSGVGTPEAVLQIGRRWRIDMRRISYGGLKDRHAETRQFLTIRDGPRRGLRLGRSTLHYLGQVAAPFTADQILGNRFQVVLRALAAEEQIRADQALKEVRIDGVANYFDDQRFGSVGRGRDFIARQLIDGDFEAALRIALAEPYPFDPTARKEEKRILRERWGRWGSAKAALPNGPARDIVNYLAERPEDFRGAFARLRTDLKSLYLAAYQSHLWNRMLARWIEQHTRPEQRVSLSTRLGPLVMPRRLDPDQQQQFHAARLPLPSARLHLEKDDPFRLSIESVLAEEGLELSRMKLKHFREPFFAKGERAAVIRPENLIAHWGADDLNQNRQKLTLSFDLPRGSYATMLVKRIRAKGGGDE